MNGIRNQGMVDDILVETGELGWESAVGSTRSLQALDRADVALLIRRAKVAPK